MELHPSEFSFRAFHSFLLSTEKRPPEACGRGRAFDLLQHVSLQLMTYTS